MKKNKMKKIKKQVMKKIKELISPFDIVNLPEVIFQLFEMIYEQKKEYLDWQLNEEASSKNEETQKYLFNTIDAHYRTHKEETRYDVYKLIEKIHFYISVLKPKYEKKYDVLTDELINIPTKKNNLFSIKRQKEKNILYKITRLENILYKKNIDVAKKIVSISGWLWD